jgi:hypothetical protein
MQRHTPRSRCFSSKTASQLSRKVVLKTQRTLSVRIQSVPKDGLTPQLQLIFFLALSRILMLLRRELETKRTSLVKPVKRLMMMARFKRTTRSLRDVPNAIRLNVSSV